MAWPSRSLHPARYGRRTGLLALTALLLAPAPHAGAQEVEWEGVRAFIHDVIRDEGLASAAVSVARGGEILWEEGFGWADRERQIRATAHTPYSLASISKPITATAILILNERGELDLDAPANAYLPPAGQLRSFQGSADAITVRGLLSHTGGLPLHYQFFYRGEGDGPPPIDTSIHRYGAALHRPGERYVYSNIGYGVLNRIVEVVSGRSFEEFSQTEIFAPLGMHRSSLDIRPGLESYAAARYGNRQERIPFYDFDHPGASAYWASAHDLVRFGLFHNGQALDDQRLILDDEARLAMQRLETPPGAPRGYGLGWIVTDDHGGHRQFGHSGGMPGVSTQLQIFPDADVVIAVVTNGSPGRAGAIANALAEVIIPGFQMPDAPEPSEPEPFTPPSSLVGTWEGKIETWERELPVTMEVRSDGSTHIQVDDGLTALLNDPQLNNGVLRGEFLGTLPSPDMVIRPHTLLVELTLEGDRLQGAVTARSTTNPIHFALSSRMEVRRTRAP